MITFITDEIAIGDSQDAKNAINENFDAALNVAIDLDIKDPPQDDSAKIRIKRHKVGLIDGRGNNPLTFAAAILLLHSLTQSNKLILVHCHAGQSRSVMVVAAWIAFKKLTSLDNALEQILPLRKVTTYRQDLYNTAKEAIAIADKITL